MRYIRAFRRGLLLIAIVIALAAATPFAAARAQISPHVAYVVGGESAPAPQPQAQEFEGDSELPWLFAVFFVTWATFFAYVFIMSRRQREMQREIDAMKRMLAGREDEARSAAKERG